MGQATGTVYRRRRRIRDNSGEELCRKEDYGGGQTKELR
jgi:hypothetical protein